MKKVLLLVISFSFGLITFAQENNGVVFSKHPAIEKTKKLWSAFEKGDKTAIAALLADSMVVIYNGGVDPQKRENYLKSIDWWSTEFENLKVVDDTPAYPDAIEYSKGGLWVQDWLVITGTHKKSGINLNLHIHNLYSFNSAGKITALFKYFNNDQFDAINSSETIQENGKIYINHPYIIAVRKLANAYCAENLAAMVDFYAPGASFSNSTMKWGESIDLAKRKKVLETDFATSDNIKMRQVGYPDCLYFAKDNTYIVYSWWILSNTQKTGGKKVEFPVMLSHTFNKEGKIVSEEAYYSSNHFE